MMLLDKESKRLSYHSTVSPNNNNDADAVLLPHSLGGACDRIAARCHIRAGLECWLSLCQTGCASWSAAHSTSVYGVEEGVCMYAYPPVLPLYEHSRREAFLMHEHIFAMQSIFAGLYNGVGAGTGALMAGALWKSHGGGQMFALMAALLLFCWALGLGLVSTVGLMTKGPKPTSFAGAELHAPTKPTLP